MRRSLIALLVGIFFSVLFVSISYYFPPFEKDSINNIVERYGITEEPEFREIIKKSTQLGVIWEVVDIRIFTAWAFSLGVVVIAYFSFLHLTIDKLFFKQFHEKPNIVTAMRRGLILYFLGFAIIGLRLMGAVNWYTVGITIVLFIMIEGLVVYLKRN